MPVIGCRCEGCRSRDPRDKRLRSSVLLEHQGRTVVIDTGPDFRQQMLRAGVSNLDAILFTHEHRDHMAGLDDIRAYNFIQHSPMDIFAEKRVMRALRKGFPYIFAVKKYPGIPRVNMHSITLKPFSIGKMEVIPIRLMHYRLPILGFRIGDFAYLTDGKWIPESEKKKLSGVKHMVISALRKEPHISHFTLAEVLEIFSELAPEKGYLTHMSHQLGPVSLFEKELPEGVSAAYDGLTLEL